MDENFLGVDQKREKQRAKTVLTLLVVDTVLIGVVVIILLLKS